MNITDRLDNYSEFLEFRISNLEFNRKKLNVFKNPIAFVKNIGNVIHLKNVYEKFNKLYSDYRIDSNTYSILVGYRADNKQLEKGYKRMEKSYNKVNKFIDKHR